MPRISTTVDRELDRRLRAEARHRRITRARLLREAAIHYLGASEGTHALAELRAVVAEQEARLERLERQLAAAAVLRQPPRPIPRGRPESPRTDGF
ncbi:hypothetical protein VSS74_25065 [Conexibacter stalactiti]|uniref:Ribbon-helix-helix protein CopG domain-containing protein n=1 Tax=Conexibacter stalactiti TaxID=1940611 RepID=A0ABU4HWE1_9ACTN|nr:hypothetical protein [Conexibacter stalactiti]MDW5597646.1 hypothetical protein [Conexibacter stalactiti]MEC5038288.1 hypothetical protein [Conexibacter stalactiti]